MELTPGYKSSELGAIPETWSTPTLGEIVTSTQLGGTYKLTTRETPWPFIKMGNVGRGRIYPDKTEFISGASSPAARDRLHDGDLLLNTRNTPDLVGKVAIWRSELPEAYFDSNLMRIKFNGERVATTRFMNWALNSAASIRGLRGLAIGTTSVAAIYNRDLVGLRIALPMPGEQRAIAEVLENIDALVCSLDRLVAKKQGVMQGAMQQLLTGRTRLPGFPQASNAMSTTVGRFPPDWVVHSVKSLVDPTRSIRYGIVQPGRYDPRGRYMIRGQDYSAAKGWAEPAAVFRVSPAVEERYKNARVRAGDLIMTIVGYAGHVEMVPGWLDGANLTQTTARISIDPRLADPAYCKFFLRSWAGQRQVASYLKGAAQPGLNCGDVERFVVCAPPTLNEQHAVAAVLSHMEAEIEALEARRVKTELIKVGLMQALLTGRTRLRLDEPEGEDPEHSTNKPAELAA